MNKTQVLIWIWLRPVAYDIFGSFNIFVMLFVWRILSPTAIYEVKIFSKAKL